MAGTSTDRIPPRFLLAPLRHAALAWRWWPSAWWRWPTSGRRRARLTEDTTAAPARGSRSDLFARLDKGGGRGRGRGDRSPDRVGAVPGFSVSGLAVVARRAATLPIPPGTSFATRRSDERRAYALLRSVRPAASARFSPSMTSPRRCDRFRARRGAVPRDRAAFGSPRARVGARPDRTPRIVAEAGQNATVVARIPSGRPWKLRARAELPAILPPRSPSAIARSTSRCWSCSTAASASGSVSPSVRCAGRTSCPA